MTATAFEQSLWNGGILRPASSVLDNFRTTSRLDYNTRFISFNDYSPLMNGDPSDTDKLIQAFADANSNGLALSIPVGTIRVNKAITNLCSFFGVLGKTKFIIDDVVDVTGAPSSGHIFQSAWVRTYNDSTAKNIDIRDIIIELTPKQNIAVIGLTNISRLNISNVDITSFSYINPSTSLPYKTDSLIDLYACVKNARISNNRLNNITYARGIDNEFAAGGGGEIWVRNICSSALVGADLANATENIEIDHNIFTHNTSDEGLAVYGVIGMTRNVDIHNNIYFGTSVNPSNVCYHNTLISVFPLKHATLGANASVENVVVRNNHIEDSSWFYSIMRFGNSTDTNSTNICRHVKSSGNTIIAFRTTNATYKPHQIWLNAGSIGTDPDTANLALRAIQVTGTFGSFKNAGFTSDNDTIVSTADSVLMAINGFNSVTNPTTLGAIWYATASCDNVSGGNLESTNSPYYNIKNVSGGHAKCNLSTGKIFYVDSSSLYTFSGVTFTSAGNLLSTSSGSTATILLNGNAGTTGNAALNVIDNGTINTYIKSHCNLVIGAMSGAIGGAGATTVDSALNKYGSTTD